MHLAAGIHRWQTGRFEADRGNPPLVGLVAAGPALLAGPKADWSRAKSADAKTVTTDSLTRTVTTDFFKANGPRTCWLVTMGRWACIVFCLVGGCCCFLWAAELYGYASGLTALTLWCFSPNVLAYGQLVTGDIAATAMGLAAFYGFWRWLSRPSWGRATLAGTFLGLAELSKFVWVVLYLWWPLLWIFWRLSGRGQTARPSLLREIGQLAFIVLLGVYVINLGYGFESPFEPLEHFGVNKQMTKLLPASVQPYATAALPWLGGLPVPLPENYVLGVNELPNVASVQRSTYLWNQWREGGWWYYYPYAYAVKMPLGALGLLGLACFVSPWLPGFRKTWRTELLFFLSIVVVVAFVSRFGANQRLRYGLPAPLRDGLGQQDRPVAGRKADGADARRRTAAELGGVNALWTYPHCLPYYNETVGGPLKGQFLLDDSHYDWGQDFFYLQRWLKNHPEASRPGLEMEL